MMKFASFETVVEMIYKYAIPTPKDQCSKNLQLGVSFGGGYIAGVLCAIVSHPADNLVSFLNNAKGATVGDVSTPPLFIQSWPFGNFSINPRRCLSISSLSRVSWTDPRRPPPLTLPCSSSDIIALSSGISEISPLQSLHFQWASSFSPIHPRFVSGYFQINTQISVAISFLSKMDLK